MSDEPPALNKTETGILDFLLQVRNDQTEERANYSRIVRVLTAHRTKEKFASGLKEGGSPYLSSITEIAQASLHLAEEGLISATTRGHGIYFRITRAGIDALISAGVISDQKVAHIHRYLPDGTTPPHVLDKLRERAGHSKRQKPAGRYLVLKGDDVEKAKQGILLMLAYCGQPGTDHGLIRNDLARWAEGRILNIRRPEAPTESGSYINKFRSTAPTIKEAIRQLIQDNEITEETVGKGAFCRITGKGRERVRQWLESGDVNLEEDVIRRPGQTPPQGGRAQ